MRETVSFLSERTMSEWEGMRETEFFEFWLWVFWETRFESLWSAGHVAEKKSSPTDSISIYKNRVHWTRFICKKPKPNRLSFYTYKSSPTDSIDSVFVHRNRVQWTRFLCIRGHFVHLSYWPKRNSSTIYSIL